MNVTWQFEDIKKILFKNMHSSVINLLGSSVLKKKISEK